MDVSSSILKILAGNEQSKGGRVGESVGAVVGEVVFFAFFLLDFFVVGALVDFTFSRTSPSPSPRLLLPRR